MQGKMPDRNLRAGARPDRAPHLLLNIMLAFGLCAVATARAQQSDAAQSKDKGARGHQVPVSTRTRTRRVTKAPFASKSSPAGEGATEGTSSASTTSGKHPAVIVDIGDPPPMPADTRGRDRISALREQIRDAGSEDERVRLERMLVEYLIGLERNQEAITELRLMMREERFDPHGFYNIGNALARLGDSDTAVDAYRKAIGQRHGNYSRALNNLGVVLLRTGRWNEAYDALVSALKLENFSYAEASYNLGRLYAARGEADLAIREWSRVLLVQPDHADAALALSRAYAEDGNPQRGIAVLDAWTRRNGANSEIAAMRRLIISDLPAGRIKGSASSIPPLRPLAIDRETYDLLQHARAAREAGLDEESIQYYRRVLSRRGGLFPPANLELSYVLIKLKRTDEAMASLQNLTEKEGARYPVAYYHLGRLYENSGQLSLAEEAYRRAATAPAGETPQFLLDVSRVREKQGNFAGALQAMESYVRINEHAGQTPEWAADRLAQLRQKAAASARQTSAPKR